MERIRFGATGLKVSRFALGTMTLGDALDERASHELLDVATESGIDLIDTANAYNAGLTEEIVGRWLAARGQREQVVLVSKVRYPVGDDQSTAGLTPKVVVRELEATLRRLQTDYLDLYILHQPDDDTPIEVTLRCLDALVVAGKVRCIGLSNFAAWQVVEAIHIARQNGWARPLVCQFMYNAIARAADAELLPMTRAYDLGNMLYNPLAGGLLTGKHPLEGEAASGTRLESNDMYRRRYWNPRQRAAAWQLQQIAVAGGRTPVELALRFLLDLADATTILLGATRPEQLHESLRSLQAAPLSDEERRGCEDVWNTLRGPIPPYNRSNTQPEGTAEP